MEVKKSLPPGTIYNSSTTNTPTTINKIYYNEANASLNKVIPDSQVWIRVNGFTDTESIVKELVNEGIDNLIVEDVFHLTQRSKIEEIDNGFFAIIKTSTYKKEHFEHDYLSIILKDNLVFTFNDKPSEILNVIEERLNKNQGSIRKHNARYLFYTIIDTLMDNNIIFENEINNLLSVWEEKIISDKAKNIDKLHQIRKEILIIKTNIYSLVTSLDLMDDFFKKPQVNEFKKYYQDFIDHLYRLNDKLNLDWENVKTLNDMHMNNINERTNVIMKILTIFSATFIPLSFLAGVFGMNFTNMPILSNANGVWIFVGLCVMIFVIMLGFFKYKKWF